MKRILKRYLALLLVALLVITGTPMASFAVEATPSITNLVGTATGATSGEFTWDYNLPSGYDLHSSSSELNSVPETVDLSTEKFVLEGLVAETDYALDIKAEFISNEIDYTVDKIVTTSYDTITYPETKVYTRRDGSSPTKYYEFNEDVKPNPPFFTLTSLIEHLYSHSGYTINPIEIEPKSDWEEHTIDIEFIENVGTISTIYKLGDTPFETYDDAKNSILSILDYEFVSEDSDFNSSNQRKFTVVKKISFELNASLKTQVEPVNVDYTISLVVENGGIAIYDTKEFGPGTHSLIVKTGDEILVRSYSNAGYRGNGQYNYTVTGEGNEEIRVSFTKENDVYELPFYVTDGFFSGYDFNGVDISNNDPKSDILSAIMSATPDKTEYVLGDTASVTLVVTDVDGDDSNNKLNEVDFYENGINKQTFGNAPDSNDVIYNHTIPSIENDLIDAGFKKTSDGTNNIYTKSLHYDLVDRYDGEDAAAIITTAKTALIVIVQIPLPTTHTVYAISNDTSQGTVSPEESILGVEETVELVATPKSKYFAFDYWTKTVGDEEKSYDGAASITVPSEDATYTAHFKKILFDVTFDADIFLIDGMVSNTSGTIGKITFSSDNESFEPFSLNGSEPKKTKISAIPEGTMINIFAESIADDYRFLKYENNNQNPRSVTINSKKTNVEPNAVFGKKDEFSVTADYDKLHVTFDKESAFLDDSKYTFTATPDANTTITKVTIQYGENPADDITTDALTEAGLMSYSLEKFESDVRFVVESLTQFDVNADSSDPTQGKVSPTASRIKAGQPITVVATSESGFTFSNWRKIIDDSEVVVSEEASYTFDVNENVSLVAYFTADQVEDNKTTYTVTFVNADTNNTVLKTEEVESGKAATAPAIEPTLAGHTFTGWDIAFTNIIEPLTVKAVYTKDQELPTKFTVTFVNADEAKTVLKTEEVESGKAATAPTTDPTLAGHTFTGWDKAFTNITEPLTVTAVYSLNVVNNNDDDDEEELEERTISAPSPQVSEPVTIVDLGEEEELPAGPAIVEEKEKEPKEELITLDIPNEAIPEGSGLPQTGQLPAELFVGLGGLITAAGAFLKRKK